VYGLPTIDHRAAVREPGRTAQSDQSGGLTGGVMPAPRSSGRSTPLIVVASASPGVADSVAARLRREGNVVYITHSAEGCLRVATSVAPDAVVVDPALPRRLISLLQAHPGTAQARIVSLSPQLARPSAAPAPALHAAA
jgi:hypothetical protein